MYTECPNCHTFFKVTPAHLKVASGKVRCGNCNDIFNALETLMDEVPASALARGKQQASATHIAKEFANDIEVLDEQDDSFADIDVPGTDGLKTDDNSGFAALSTDSNFDRPSGSTLPDLSDLTEISAPGSTIKVSSALKMQSDSEDSIGLSGLAELEDLVMDSDIPSSITNQSVVASESKIANSTRSRADLNEINRDIDEALDGLFDEEIAVENSKPVKTSSSIHTNKILEDIDLSGLPNLEASDDLPELNLEKVAQIKSSLSDLELDLSDEDAGLQGKKSKNQKSGAKKKDSVPSPLEEFELGDSLLSVESLKIDENDWSPEVKDTGSSELYSGDSFILEELENGGVQKPIRRRSKVFWVLAIFLLGIVLAGQIIYLKRETIIKYPQLASLLEFECQLIGSYMPCEIPVKRDPELIELMDRNVVSHPNAENALLISATIKNNAEFDQPFADMILTFSDINQKVVARRMFKPEEYLSKDMDISHGMKAGVPIKIILEIVDPGEDAVNFQFDFK